MTAMTILYNILCHSSCLAKHSSHNLSAEEPYDGVSICSSKQLIFKFSEKSLWRRQTVADCRDEIRVSLSGQVAKERVFSKTINFAPGFDTRAEDMFRNIRRCSLAPLGDSYLIKQFELDSKSGKHFNHVIKIEPREQLTLGSIIPQPPQNLADLLQMSSKG